MSAYVDMLFVTPLVGEVTNASTCRHVVIEPVRSTQLVGVIHQQIVALLVGIIHWP
ncbi:hypothetical protein SLEP1_g24495 [Rubroshorea leprosula]|uniref:Uncharacterized protein n=1 Tax=Rubroshorea leprosula TaxID=152421 RepID=A0AAV5JT47_9ROSI|nr:hypothetical protein SLEP1_g24495 [Rubroshorea leprosula]